MQTRGSPRGQRVGSEAAAKTDEGAQETCWEVAGRYFTEVLFSEYFEQVVKNRSGVPVLGTKLTQLGARYNFQNAFVT